MTERPVWRPSAEHPITVAPTDGRVVVRVNDEVIADSRRALTLQEASYPAVQYIPLSDVNDRVLRDSPTASYCPYKGDAGYYGVDTAAGTVEDAAWYYRDPYPAVAAIAGHLAFYPDKAQISISPA